MDVGYECHGAGTPVLFIAGWCQSRAFWHPFVDHLPPGVLGVFPDNREAGETGPCPEGFTLDDIAADHLALMAGLGHERFAVVGHSMGGMVAQALTLAAPERVTTLVLASTHGGVSVAEPVDVSIVAPPAGLDLPDDPVEASVVVRAAILERLLGPGSETEPAVLARREAERAPGMPLEGIVRQLAAIGQFDPGDALARLDVAVRVGHGSADVLVPTASGERLAARHRVPLTRFEGIGHMVPWEAPARFAAFVAASLGVGGP